MRDAEEFKSNRLLHCKPEQASFSAQDERSMERVASESELPETGEREREREKRAKSKTDGEAFKAEARVMRVDLGLRVEIEIYAAI